MKILIVDDNTNKAGKLIKVLTVSGIDRESIDTVSSAMGARERLKTNFYNLLVLDLLLPLREEDDPTLETSLNLITEISERDGYFKPRHIVGFTAFGDEVPLADATFKQHTWTIVPFDPTSTAWETQFQNVAGYLIQSEHQPTPQQYKIDICIVTALQKEMDAVYRLGWDWDEPEPLDDSTFVRRATFECDGVTAQVVTSHAVRMGSVSAALLTSKLIDHFRPRFVVMPGICAGVRNKVELGDVVLFDPVWEWPSGKLSDGEGGTYLEPSPHQIATSEFIVARAVQMQQDNMLWPKIQNAWAADSPSTALKLVIGPGASGSAVVADSITLEAIQQQHRKLTAVEMEAYGVCAAVRGSTSPRPTALIMKSVADFADSAKTDDWQAYACNTSANCMDAFFKRYFKDIKHLAGT